jgi:ribosomal protein S18 acetylase RimI-like enzyme
VVIRPISNSDLSTVQSLLVAGGWEQRAADITELTELIQRSQVALVAEAEGQVVGFVRALTDNIANGYISMLVVAPQSRKRGVGSALVKACMGSNPEMTWVLRAGRPGLLSFYEKLGFQVSTVAMERPRKKRADSSPSK